MTKDVLGYFGRMHQIIDLPEYNNAMIAGQYIMEAMTTYNMTLADIEDLLRELSSRVCLIGLPLSFFADCEPSCKVPEGYSIVPMLPNGKKFKYGLWVEMNGLDALKKLTEKLTDIDRSLKDTGFLCLLEAK
jgi:hypothetical protein